MSAVKRSMLVIAVLLSCVGCDQTTKSVAKSLLSQAEAWSFLGDTVRLQLANNYGSFLSVGDSLPDVWRHGLLSVGLGCVLLGLLAYLFISKSIDPRAVLALSLFVGGGTGNLLDRLLYGGNVVDFINIGIGSVRTGIFNVADVAISLGMVLLVFREIRAKSRRVDATESS
jgi:signal peptidase II